MIKPTLQALVLADHVYVDKMTNKFVIAGTYHQLGVVPRPAAQEAAPEISGGMRKLQLHEILGYVSTFVYISLTNIRGNVPLELRYVSLSDHSVLLKMEIMIPGDDDPLKTWEMGMQVPPLPSVVGVYAMELLFQDEPLGSHRVQVVEIQPPHQKEEGQA